MRKILSFVLFMFCMYGMYAQNVSITGNVKDAEDQMGLPGVNVIAKNLNTAAVTDFDGNFNIDVPVGTVLEFSYLGFETTTVTAVNANPLKILLKVDAQSLSEVVVIGYGTQTKKEITGAVSIVDSKTIEQLRPIKVEQALQGTVSGVNVTSQSGSPGAGLDIRIRGIGTNGENKPLVIIDGYQGDIDLLNPSDIESITVLKDAQAAIYGTIGANGVILVTTKTGKLNSKAKFSFNSYYGFQQTSKKMNLLDATEYAVLKNESYANAGNAIPFTDLLVLGSGTDWQDEIFSISPIVNHDLSVSGGGEKITYSISGSTLDQEGIVGPDKSNYLRNTGRVALGAQVTPKAKIETNLIYTYQEREKLQEGGLGSVLFNALNAPPTLSVYDEDGEFTLLPATGIGTEVINPLAQLNDTHNNYNQKKLNGNVSLTYDFSAKFSATTRIGFNTANSEEKTFNKEVDYGGKNADVSRSFVKQETVNDNNYTFDTFLTYSDLFADMHKVKVTLGNTTYKTWGNGLNATGFDVPNNLWEFADIDLANGVSEDDASDVGSYTYDERRLSYFGRLEYNYDGKYLLSAMIRRDSSTKFGPDNRVAYFPSATLGWVASDENFFGNGDVVSFAKLRLSYGVLGNDQIPDNAYVGTLDGIGNYIFDGSVANGVAIGRISNPELKWEEAKKFDVGVDLKFFNNKLDMTADYFINTRENLLIEDLPVSGITGAYGHGSSSSTSNAGSVRNSGFEFAVTYRDQIGKDFNYTVSYNITHLKNEVLEVNNDVGFIEGGSFGEGQADPARMEAGQPIGYFYGYKTDGLFQNQSDVDNHASQFVLDGENTAKPGDLRYVDLNNDGVIDEDDKTNIGDPIPDFTMGLNFNIQYRGFDFVAYAFASLGNEVLRNYERGTADTNLLNYKLDRWTGEGTSNSVPSLTIAQDSNNVVLSEFFIEDGSYLRIQNVQLGYTIPEEVTKQVGISKFRIYTGVNNLYTFTKYRGFDPGATSGDPIGGGIDFGVYPIPRTYMLGVNVNF